MQTIGKEINNEIHEILYASLTVSQYNIRCCLQNLLSNTLQKFYDIKHTRISHETDNLTELQLRTSCKRLTACLRAAEILLIFILCPTQMNPCFFQLPPANWQKFQVTQTAEMKFRREIICTLLTYWKKMKMHDTAAQQQRKHLNDLSNILWPWKGNSLKMWTNRDIGSHILPK
jgi:hypothetical protein